MKIVFSVGMYDNKSGIVKVVKNIAKALGRIDTYHISILCTGIDAKCSETVLDGVDIINMDIEKYGHRKKYLHYTKAIKNTLEKLMPDIIVVSGTEHVLFYSIGTSRMKSGAPRLFVWEHRNFSAGPKFRLEWFGKRYALRHWNGVICITKKDAIQYVDYVGSATKIHQIYNLTDFSEVRKQYNFKSKKIISCGYLAHIKGFDLLVKVAKQVFEKHSDWVWDIYGEGTDRQKLQKLIEDYSLQNHVFLKGYASNINELYGKYSFFVLTSRAEGMGMVLIEAQKSGLPTVSFDIKCGPSDVISDGVNGYLIEPFNIGDMSEKINWLHKG